MIPCISASGVPTTYVEKVTLVPSSVDDIATTRLSSSLTSTTLKFSRSPTATVSSTSTIYLGASPSIRVVSHLRPLYHTSYSVPSYGFKSSLPKSTTTSGLTSITLPIIGVVTSYFSRMLSPTFAGTSFSSNHTIYGLCTFTTPSRNTVLVTLPT